jgi:AAA family ATP:ADP antiporter
MEVLFTVVPREDKYKAKNIIETFVYRGGDQLGAVVLRWPGRHRAEPGWDLVRGGAAWGDLAVPWALAWENDRPPWPASPRVETLQFRASQPWP